MSWYRTGTITLPSGSATVTGSGTAFAGNVEAGMMLVHDMRVIGEVQTVVSATELTLAAPYEGASITAEPYAIINLGSVRGALLTAFAWFRDQITPHLSGSLIGRFQDGTVNEPGIAFKDQVDLGFRRSGADEISATGTLIVPALVGDAVTQSPTDATPGRLLKVGDAGILTHAPPHSGLSDTVLRGDYSYKFDDPDNPAAGSGSFEVFRSGFGGTATQIARPMLGGQYIRSGPASGDDWGAWSAIIQQEDIVPIDSGSLALAGSEVNGAQFVLANNAVAELTPPNRRSGYLALSEASNGDVFPQTTARFFGYVDLGDSPMVEVGTFDIGADTETTTSTVLTGTAGTNGKLTIGLASSGKIQIENRLGGTRALNLTFI